MEFYETTEFGGQTDNRVGPSLACLLAFCRTAGFARVELESVLEHGACVACYRHWKRPEVDAPEGPELLAAEHNQNAGINFDSSRDEMVSAWFRWPAPNVALDDVRPEVGGYGVRPLQIAHLREDVWQTNFKLPPGLTAGWHEVRMRIGESSAGSPQRIAVDVPLVGGRDSDPWRQRWNDVAAGPARFVARGNAVVLGQRSAGKCGLLESVRVAGWKAADRHLRSGGRRSAAGERQGSSGISGGTGCYFRVSRSFACRKRPGRNPGGLMQASIKSAKVAMLTACAIFISTPPS